MRALSVKQPWAELIARGDKTIEYRTWSRDFRGDLLIVASKGRDDDLIEDEGFDPKELTYGAAMCVVDLVDITGEEGDYEWHLARPRRVEPVPIKGYASIYNVDDSLIRWASNDRPIPSRVDPPEEEEDDEEEDEDEVDEREEVDPTSLNVLVVDDEGARMGRIVEAVVDALGAAPTLSLPRDAIELAKVLEPEIVIAPTMLPIQSGLEIALAIRKTRWGKKTKILLLQDEGMGSHGMFSVETATPSRPDVETLREAITKLVKC